MSTKEQLTAYLATLLALVITFVTPFVASGFGVSITEAFGVGVVTGGLIGVLRIPTNRTVSIDNPPSNPVPVEAKDARE